jgi:hypothetical protein
LRHLLPATAIAASTLALLSATPIPVIGTNDDLRNLAIGAAIVCWFAIIAAMATAKLQQHLDTLQGEVDEVRRLAKIARMLEEAGAGNAFTLPTPQGDIRPIPTKVDGRTVVVGVDESTDLADVIELRRAVSAGDDKAAL